MMCTVNYNYSESTAHQVTTNVNQISSLY